MFKADYTEGHYQVEKEMNGVWNDSYQTFQSWLIQADYDSRFKLGDQKLYGRYYQNMVDPLETQFNFNHLMRIHNSILGQQIQRRKSPQIIPQENSDSQTASQFTTLQQYIFKKSDFYSLVTQAFSQALTTGFGAIELWLDKRTDPVSPDIKGYIRGYSSIIFDPYFQKLDLSDSNFLWSRSYLTPSECKQVLPNRDKDIDYLCNRDYKDDKFQYMLENWNLKPTKLAAVDNYWHLSTRTAKYVTDIYTDDSIEITEDMNEDFLKERIQKDERLQIISREVPTVKLAIAVNSKVLYYGNPYGIDQYPIIPFFGYMDGAANEFSLKVQGIIRQSRDVQFLYNRRKRIELDILESSGTTTLAILENTLVDDRQAFQTGQGRRLFVKRDAPMGLDGIRPLPAPSVGQDMLAISQQLKEEIGAIVGGNDEVFGNAETDVAGIVTWLRQGAGMTTLAPLFDNLDHAQIQLQRVINQLIIANWTTSKVRRILNEEPTPQFKTKAFQKYDAIVTEGMLTETQRKMEFGQLLELTKLGLPIPPDYLLKPLTIQNKDKLVEYITKQQEQQAKMQEQQQMLQMQQLKNESELLQARAIADTGLGVERISRVQENKTLAVEREAQARENMADSERAIQQANLDYVKSLKEIDQMELDRIYRAYQILKEIEQEKFVNKQAINQEEQHGIV